MSGPSIHDLLGLPAEITQPNPYQVFGLMLGEADGQVIRAAIEHRVALLKQVKSETDPEVWSKAARAVQAAQKVLSDPEQKAALDATYGIISDPEPAPTMAFDPLAALLPGSAAQLPMSTPTPTEPTQRAELAGPAISTPASELQPATSWPAPPSAVAPTPPDAPPPASMSRAAHRRPVRRKRGSGMFIFGSMVLLLLACLALGAVYVFVKGGVQVVTGPDGIQIKTGTNSPESAGSPVVNPPSPVIVEPKGDGILKPPPPIRPDAPNLGDDVSMQPGMQPPTSQDSPAMVSEMPEMGMPTAGTMPETGTPEPPPMVPEPAPAPVPPTPEPTPPTPEPTPEPTPQMATPEELATGDAAIAAARTAIVSGKWDTMKSLAETAEKLAASDPQKQTAETLYQFADLATFYRSAVQKAMSDLVAGNVFKLGENMDFLVQRSSASEVVLYRNKREYPYTLDALPISVAHALAPFALNADSPEGQAAMAVYQSISSKTTAGHRAQSVEILRGLDSVKGADPQRLADLIESFGS